MIASDCFEFITRDTEEIEDDKWYRSGLMILCDISRSDIWSLSVTWITSTIGLVFIAIPGEAGQCQNDNRTV